jgi:hypothetical protein
VQQCITQEGQRTAMLNHIDNLQWDNFIDKVTSLTPSDVNTDCLQGMAFTEFQQLLIMMANALR